MDVKEEQDDVEFDLERASDFSPSLKTKSGSDERSVFGVATDSSSELGIGDGVDSLSQTINSSVSSSSASLSASLEYS